MFLFTSTGERYMPRNQIERLKNDSRELDNYIHRLKKKGRDNLAHKLSKKKTFLNQTIAEYESSTQILA
tara:strand:+ start:4429 stop:4635 length:207 start_codon:yes stop_codon:yes gene_type:complete